MYKNQRAQNRTRNESGGTCKKIFVTKQTISNWENNNIQPSIDMLVKIADFFSVSTDYLLGRDDIPVVNVDGLTIEQISHIEFLVKDLKKSNLHND